MEFLFLNEELRNIIANNNMTIVYFGSNMCGVCGAIEPKIIELLIKYPKIKYVHVDVEKSREIAATYNIFTIPGILLFIDGKEVIREARYISVQDLDNKISRYYDLYYEE
ncbi:MAG: thioredoxin family protein [Sedimentibacter sp.]